MGDLHKPQRRCWLLFGHCFQSGKGSKEDLEIIRFFYQVVLISKKLAMQVLHMIIPLWGQLRKGNR
jgi:hypothetical protein